MNKLDNRDMFSELQRHFDGDIRADPAAKILYSTDASIYQIEPLGVAIPKSQEGLIAAVEFGAKYKIPILPRGAGTSLAGQAIGRAFILDCSRWLDKIIEIDSEEHFAVVEPGVVLADLNRAAAKHGLMFGPDPASAERATMGGVIANNATGAHSILYGMSADHVLEAEVILGDGSLERWGEQAKDKLGRMKDEGHRNSGILSIVHQVREKYAEAIKQNYPQTWRNAAGYRLNYLLPWSPSAPPQWIGETYPANLKQETWNPAHLLAGSEGTLAVIRRLKVNLIPKPKHTVLAVLSYHSIAEACDDVPRLLEHSPSAIELIPRMIVRAARSVPAFASQMSWVVGDPEALLVVEFSGDDERKLKSEARGFDTWRDDQRHYSTTCGRIMTIAESKEEQARVWNVRKVGLGLMDSKPGSARPAAFIEDCGIPVARLGEFVREVEKILSAHGVEGGMYAHASAGCLHIRPILDLKTTRGVESLRGISEAVLSLTMRLGGTLSSEHGDGLTRSEHLEKLYGEQVMSAMRLLKQAADPHNLLNPGKILDAPPMDANLRFGANYRAQAWTPSLSFEREVSLPLAIEACNGQGVCRKSSGVMCPSFQATRDEMHSTRGRANLLRALVAGYKSQVALPSILNRKSEIEKSVFDALDLCLACKGCKAECPSGVDMAKLKYEFEHNYYKTHRRPLRDYLFGYFHAAAKILAPLAPLANWLMEFPLTKKLIARGLGLADERPLPRFAARRVILSGATSATKNLLHRAESLRSAQSDTSLVILLPDVFSRYIEPQVEDAALEVLTACGYDVRVLPIVGAGASLLSKGFVEAARRHAAEVLRLVKKVDPQNEAMIVGVEPPEIYLLKNEYDALYPARAEELRELSQRVWMLDELLLRSKEFDVQRVATSPPAPLLKGEGSKIFFHPHCHQSAEAPAVDGLPSGAEASAALLRACGYEVEVSDAGCCGMAGTFGFEAEHYEVSMKVGELRLLPKIRKAEVRMQNIVSTGAACRMQVRHGTGREARHTIEWVRDWLVSGE